MPTKRVSAAHIRQTVAGAKTKPTNPAKGRTIQQHLKQSLARILFVPRTEPAGERIGISG